MKNCKNCVYSTVDPDGAWYCRYTGSLKDIPFPVFTKGGPKKCECYEDGRVRPKFTYPKKDEKKGGE